MLMFISDRNDHTFSTNMFSYFIANIVTIVSTPLLQKRYTAFEYHSNVCFCLSWRITGSQVCQQGRVSLFQTAKQITTGCNVCSSTLLPSSQLCYPRKYTMSTVLSSCNWIFNSWNYGYELDIAYLFSRDIWFPCRRFCRSRMKIGIVLRIVLKAYEQVHQVIDGSTLIWENIFGCSSYITFPPDRNSNEVHICLLFNIQWNLSMTTT